jgi:hypothetical protein
MTPDTVTKLTASTTSSTIRSPHSARRRGTPARAPASDNWGGGFRLLHLEALARELQRPAVLRHGPYNRVRYARRHFGIDLKRHLDPRSDEAGEVRDHLVGDAPRVAPHARRVECDCPWKRFGFVGTPAADVVLVAGGVPSSVVLDGAAVPADTPAVAPATGDVSASRCLRASLTTARRVVQSLLLFALQRRAAGKQPAGRACRGRGRELDFHALASVGGGHVEDDHRGHG